MQSDVNNAGYLRTEVEITVPYDFAVVQWMTSCHINRMTTRVRIFWCELVVIDNDHVNSAFTSLRYVHFQGILNIS